MKTFYGEGRIYGNMGTFFVETENMDQARNELWNATARVEGAQRPNLLKTANAKMEEQLQSAAEKGESARQKYTYDLGYGVTFLEFWKPQEEEEEEG